ncbi:l-psp endoribonuclease family [Colletotrichum camelliae]|nr:l-psp endoribonuclease family [Colletotrichum camelliae]
MSHLTFFTYEGFGSKALQSHAYNQAVRMDNQIWISGQGGWDRRTTELSPDATAQIDQAFDNVDFVLKDAGGKGWEQVAVVRSYHIGLSDEAQEAMVRNFRRWMPNHKALWTAVGVGKLGDERMLVEIEVVAHDPVKR